MNATKLYIFLGVCLILSSCSSTKYVADGEYLLDHVEVVDDASKTELSRFVRQKPNTRLFGLLRFHLGLYNMSGNDESKWINRSLREMGEPPVIYNPVLMNQSTGQIKAYLKNSGYFEAEVHDSVIFYGKRARVVYSVERGTPTTVDVIDFSAKNDIENNPSAARSGLMSHFLADTVNTLLHKGMPLDVSLLSKERERVAERMRTLGYYNFSPNLLNYEVDTLGAASGSQVLLTPLLTHISDTLLYQRYFVRDVFVELMDESQSSSVDTVRYDGFTILFHGRKSLRPSLLTETVQLLPYSFYNAHQVDESYRRLQALGLYKYINIVFRDAEDYQGQKALNCYITLTPVKRQNYSVSVEGTHASGNLGVGGDFSYGHRNLFHGGENFTIGVWGGLRKEKVNAEGAVFNTSEYGVEASLTSPQFWMPIFNEFRKEYAPKSTVKLSYGYEHTPYFTRKIVNAGLGYSWVVPSGHIRYRFDLIDANYVLMSDVDTLNFLDGLKNEFIRSAYTDHFIFPARFSMTYSDQVFGGSAGNTNYLRVNLQTAGNLLRGINVLMGTTPSGRTGEDDYYEIFGTRYAQFVKGDIEYRYHARLNSIHSFAARLYVGVGFPYFNMPVLPFEEAYYCGGANDLRAWQAWTLGPGSNSTEVTYPNSVGDFKLAGNVEYRFKLFWLMEGALFVDAGNVWTINQSETRADARLTKDFYKQIAVGTGFGLRLNANFFLIRCDLGMKVLDPTLPDGERFVFDKTGFAHPIFNFAIGYPF